MSLGTSNRDGGKTSESGHLRAIYKGVAGEVLAGLGVTQRGAGANMSVDIAVGDAILPRSDATYGHAVFNDATLNKTIPTSDPSNPRRDIVIMYLDYTVTPSTGVSNNTNGVVLTTVVAGTPAGSPADPSDAALQSAAGSGNPYIKLARVRVGAGVTSIANSVIDDLRQMAEANNNLNIGWHPLETAWDAWGYSSWDSTNKLGVVGLADSSIFTLFQRVRYWQTTGGWKYGVLTQIPNSTSIKLYQGPNYTLNNERIYIPAVSGEAAPSGFPRELINYRPYKFSVYRNSAWTTGSNAYALVTFDTKEFDTGVNYDTSTGKFTAPVAGTYRFSSNLSQAITTNGDNFKVGLYKNGSIAKTLSSLRASSGGGVQQISGGSTSLQLAANDYIQIYSYSDGANTGGTGATETWFTGELISET